jgi:hypothetical protein
VAQLQIKKVVFATQKFLSKVIVIPATGMPLYGVANHNQSNTQLQVMTFRSYPPATKLHAVQMAIQGLLFAEI